MFVLVTGLFFLWGIPNNLNDVLIRQFMESFEISRLQAGLVQSAFYSGYFLFSIPAALTMRRFGYKAGLITGLLLYAIGCSMFLPAAIYSSYSFFLVALFIIASGLGFLETGANPLIAQLGSKDNAVRRLNFSQAFNPIGSIVGVLIGTLFIFSGVELTSSDVSALKARGVYQVYLHHETMRVITPYLVLSAVVLIWAALIARVHFPQFEDDAASATGATYRGLFRRSNFILAVLAQFCYVGAQVGTWSYFIQYAQDYTHVSERSAGLLLTGTLVAFSAGRFLSSQLMRRFSAGRLMGSFALTNVTLVSIGILVPSWIGMICIFLTSFFMSLMFPTIFALGLRDLGQSTKLGSSAIVMAIIGGAIFTPLMGYLFQVTKSMAAAMVIPLCCYLWVAFYGFWNSRMSSSAKALQVC
jgi:FHS family L-fucose permease-like MFS transporter